MASVVIPSQGGQQGGRVLGADQTYYCFDCDCSLTIIATSDTGSIICPICGHLVLEEFETPSSPPPFLMPPPRSTASVDVQSFFPTSDTDSDVELFDPLPPPPPFHPFFLTTPINTTSTSGQATVHRVVDRLNQLHIYPPPPPPYSRNFGDFHDNFDSDVRRLRLPSSPPLPLPPPPPPYSRNFEDFHDNYDCDVRRLRLPSSPPLPLPPPPPPPPYSRNFVDFHDNFDSDVRHLRLPSSPPLPPPPPVTDQRPLCPQFRVPSAPIPLPPSERNYSELGELRLPLENSVPSSPPHAPSRSSDASDIFYSPSRAPEDEENPNQQPPSPPLPQPMSNSWDYFFPGIPDLPPNHESSSE